LKRVSGALVLSFFAHQDTAMKPEFNTFSQREAAAHELQENGITNYQKQAYTPGLSEALSRGMSPFGYSTEGSVVGDSSNKTPVADAMRMIEGAATGVIRDRNTIESGKRAEQAKELYGVPDQTAHTFVKSRMDAWRLYLGLPQKNKTFGISEFKPRQGKEDVYYYKLNNFLDDYALAHQTYDDDHFGDEKFKRSMTKSEAIRWLTLNADTKFNPEFPKVDDSSGVMGRYTLMKGQDERGSFISYYDRWNLDGSAEGEKGMVGKPLEIYDRIYYDPETFEVVKPTTK
jgi:hypothetical protein